MLQMFHSYSKYNSMRSPGQSRYVGSCRTGFNSVVKWLIGFGRLLFVGFRSYPLVFFLYPLIGFTAFRSDSYSRNRSDPILGSVRIRRDSGSSDIKKWSEFVVWDDTGFHDKTLQWLMSEHVGLYKNGGVPFIGFFRVWQHRSDRISYLRLSEITRKFCN